MNSKFYLKDLSYYLAVKFNISNSESLKALQFVFSFLLSMILKNFKVKIASFAWFSLVTRKKKNTTLFNTSKIICVPKRKSLMCTFSRTKIKN